MLSDTGFNAWACGSHLEASCFKFQHRSRHIMPVESSTWATLVVRCHACHAPIIPSNFTQLMRSTPCPAPSNNHHHCLCHHTLSCHILWPVLLQTSKFETEEGRKYAFPPAAAPPPPCQSTAQQPHAAVDPSCTRPKAREAPALSAAAEMKRLLPVHAPSFWLVHCLFGAQGRSSPQRTPRAAA